MLAIKATSLSNLLGEVLATLSLPRNQSHCIYELEPMLSTWQHYFDVLENPVMPEGAD
jgi:hypothetical protein